MRPELVRYPWPRIAAGVAAGTAVLGAAAWLRQRTRYDFADRTVLVTGGSRGLGLVLARALAARGANVALMARNQDTLGRAVESLGPGAPVLGVAGDVRQPASCARAVDEVVARFGTLDVLVNNAGLILSAPIARTGIEDFQAMLDVHFWGTINMTGAALPHLLTRPGARVVNICSIGAKVPVPHLSAYCASKFAQAGLSSVLGQELRPHGITVSTIYPGLMRTGSHLHARFRGDVAREYRLFALAAGTPVLAMSAARAARAILRAVERGQAELTLPGSMRFAARAAALAPNLTHALLAEINRWLPDGQMPSSATRPTASVRGQEVPLPSVVRAAIVLGERAATRNNER